MRIMNYLGNKLEQLYYSGEKIERRMLDYCELETGDKSIRGLIVTMGIFEH